MTKREVERGQPASLTVLHVFSGDLWAGAEVMIFNLLRELKARPCMTIIALSLNDGLLVSKLRDLGFEMRVVPESGRSFPGLCREAIRLFRNRRIDVVHAHRYKENLLAWVIAKAVGVPVRFSTIHGMPEWHGRGRRVRTRVMAWLNLMLLRKGFSAVVAVSQEIEQTLCRQYGFSPDRVAVIHNGVPLPAVGRNDPAQEQEGSGGKGLTIGTIGRCVPVKGFDLFIEIAERVCRRIEQATFVLVGEGPEKARLEQAVVARGLEGRVKFLPVCADPAYYYQSFDVYLNTSIHEGIPLTILEAMAWAKPVVAAKVGGIPEVVEHEASGFLVEGRDPDVFSAWCLALARDHALRARVGARARVAVAERFSARRMAASYAELYARLAGAAAAATVLECRARCQ